MNPNNDDNVKVNINCCYDDTNNILPFYLWWQEIQVRVLDNDHNNITVDYYASDNDYDIYIMYDTARNNNGVVFENDDDHNDVIVKHRANDSNCDVHVNNNIHIKNNDNNNITYNNNNDIPTDFYEFDTDCDYYNDHNNRIKTILKVREQMQQMDTKYELENTLASQSWNGSKQGMYH